jgi:hypothetical protein
MDARQAGLHRRLLCSQLEWVKRVPDKDSFGQRQIKGFPHGRGWQKISDYQAVDCRF